MTLEKGQKLGTYEILAHAGAGGMGEVYQARDTRLDREVAIKVLPEEWRRDTERLLRLAREAKVLASLSHPNIATVFGFEEDGQQPFLVMELAEGETLAERLQRGPLPLHDALEIATQVARAVDEAHQNGIVHRDLKPANVKVTADGDVKVLDFGLAEALVADSSSTNMANSPTISVEYTRPGVVLGTAAYMSPEQARGRSVDKRTDIWSFGVMLYECLGGFRPFDGETTSDLVARILEREPDWDALPVSLPQRLRTLLRRCLTKDRTQRLRDIGDARIELEELLQHPETVTAQTTATMGPTRTSWAWPALSVILLAALGVTLARFPNVTESTSSDRSPAMPIVTNMKQLTEATGMQQSPSLSPDGKMLLYVARDQLDKDIFLQRVGGENAINLTPDSHSDDYDPAFSPNGERIAFRSQREGGGLFIMGATGESPRRVCDEGFDPAWSSDGQSLVYTTEDVRGPYSRTTEAQLWLLDLQSMEKQMLTEGDAVGAVFSPSGNRIAYWASIAGVRDIFTISVASGEIRPVTKDSHTDWNPFFSPDGKTLYFLSDRSGTPDLWRIPINEINGNVTGAMHPVTAGAGAIEQATISAGGDKIAFMTPMHMSQIQRYEFDAKTERVLGDPKTLFTSTSILKQFDVTRDGQRLAYRTGAPREDLVVMNLDGTGRRRLMDDIHRDRGPKWSEDGKVLYFYSNRNGNYSAWKIQADGTGAKPLISRDGIDLLATVVAADERRISAQTIEGPDNISLIYELDQPLSRTDRLPDAPTNTIKGFAGMRFSPDGRYLAGEWLQNTPYKGVGLVNVETMVSQEVHAPDGGTIILTDEFRIDWIGNERFIMWDSKRDSALVYDVAARTARKIDGIQGPCDIRVINDGATLVVNRTRQESNIWMLTLGVIGDTAGRTVADELP